jgi:isocitrate dehydrogenase
VYGGIEYRQTGQVTQCLKLISRPGTEKIVRYAFEYARANGRRKVTCFTKDNIMKITDGLFHKVFEEIAAEYADIENEHWIVDIGAAKLADTPEAFDVVVLPNLYGDVLSDVAAQIAGSVGLAGSANIGESIAMFEAIHGSAPRRAGQNLANPSGLFLGAVMMLVHIGQTDVAERAHNSWLRTMEDGVHTYDIYKEGVSREKVGTREFADAVVARLGQKPETLKAVSYKSDGKGASSASHAASAAAASNKETVGVDVYLDWTDGSADELGAAVSKLSGDGLRLSSIANRGVKVYPDGNAETFCSDHWRCRFASEGGAAIKHAQIASLLARFADSGLDFIKTENLCNFDGKPGYSHAQE